MSARIFNYCNNSILFRDAGEGIPVLFLHGYLETGEVWEEFSKLLGKGYRIICPDLPGHGASACINEVHSMDLIADSMAALLSFLQIPKVHLVGHSLGGYVALAFAEKFENFTLSLSLFHSTPFADTEEKKQNRLREISLIEQGRKAQLFNVNIPRMFADSNTNRFIDQIKVIQNRALINQDEGIIALLKGMMQRKDYVSFFSTYQKPLFLVFGAMDNYISLEIAHSISDLNNKAQTCILNFSGHMGFVEESDKCANCFRNFIQLYAN